MPPFVTSSRRSQSASAALAALDIASSQLRAQSNVTGDVWVASLVAGRRDELVRLVITEAVDLMVWSLERHFIVARLCRGCELSVPPNRVVKCVEKIGESG